MAERPIFIPLETGDRLVQEVPVDFNWHSGMAPSQKKKNIAALHESAAKRGIGPVLEVSSKSDREVGRRLSAFHLKLIVFGKEATVESCYQGSKVFEKGGPFTDLYSAPSLDAKRDARLKESGRLIRFHFQGTDFPLSPPSAFYDWIYINALYPHREWLERLQACKGFTDIEFNPQKSLNCQARSVATFIALKKRGVLDGVMKSFETFKALLGKGAI